MTGRTTGMQRVAAGGPMGTARVVGIAPAAQGRGGSSSQMGHAPIRNGEPGPAGPAGRAVFDGLLKLRVRRKRDRAIHATAA